MWKLAPLVSLRGYFVHDRSDQASLSLAAQSINVTNCHTSSWDVLRCRNCFWWQCHKSPQRSEELTTLAVCWHELVSVRLYSELFRTSSTSCAEKEVLTRGWALTATRSDFLPYPSSLTTLNPCPVRAGEAWTGPNGPHSSGVLSKSEFGVKLTRCHWSCWWQQFSPKSCYNVSHMAEGCIKLSSELVTILWSCQCRKHFIKRERLGICHQDKHSHIFDLIKLF